MKFEQVIKESSINGRNTSGKSDHRDTGISPSGSITGEYGEEVLPLIKKNKKKKKINKKNNDKR